MTGLHNELMPNCGLVNLYYQTGPLNVNDATLNAWYDMGLYQGMTL